MTTSKRFAESVVLITGAARGIGRAIAGRFAAESARVMLIDLNIEPLRDAQLSENEWPFQADISDPTQASTVVEAALGRWDRIDVLINNAGIGGEPAFLDMSLQTWSRVLSVNLTGTFLVSQRVARVMAEAGGGVILHNASIAALGADGLCAAYSASKAGLIGLTRAMAVELAPSRVRVNAVSPGYTLTDALTENAGERLADHLTRDFVRAPLRRLVSVEEVAGVFAFLASEDASAITGQNVVVDCGLTSNLFVVETLPEPWPSHAD